MNISRANASGINATTCESSSEASHSHYGIYARSDKYRLLYRECEFPIPFLGKNDLAVKDKCFRRHRTKPLLSVANPPNREVLQFKGAPEIHFLLDPRSIRIDGRHTNLQGRTQAIRL